MKILTNLEMLMGDIRKMPVEHRAECLCVAINVHYKLYEDASDGEGLGVYIILKNIFQNCDTWDKIDRKYIALKQLWARLRPAADNIELMRVESLFAIIILRGFIRHMEAVDFGLHMDEELIKILKDLAVQYDSDGSLASSIRIGNSYEFKIQQKSS